MYTESSKLYNESTRVFAIKALREYRGIFEKVHFTDNKLIDHQQELLKGFRFSDDEQCFQALCMYIEKLHKAAGEKESLIQFATVFLHTISMNKQAYISAMESVFNDVANCDYHYSFEKHY